MVDIAQQATQSAAAAFSAAASQAPMSRPGYTTIINPATGGLQSVSNIQSTSLGGGYAYIGGQGIIRTQGGGGAPSTTGPDILSAVPSGNIQQLIAPPTPTQISQASLLSQGLGGQAGSSQSILSRVPSGSVSSLLGTPSTSTQTSSGSPSILSAVPSGNVQQLIGSTPTSTIYPQYLPGGVVPKEYSGDQLGVIFQKGSPMSYPSSDQTSQTALQKYYGTSLQTAEDILGVPKSLQSGYGYTEIKTPKVMTIGEEILGKIPPRTTEFISAIEPTKIFTPKGLFQQSAYGYGEKFPILKNIDYFNPETEASRQALAKEMSSRVSDFGGEFNLLNFLAPSGEMLAFKGLPETTIIGTSREVNYFGEPSLTRINVVGETRGTTMFGETIPNIKPTQVYASQIISDKGGVLSPGITRGMTFISKEPLFGLERFNPETSKLTDLFPNVKTESFLVPGSKGNFVSYLGPESRFLLPSDLKLSNIQPFFGTNVAERLGEARTVSNIGRISYLGEGIVPIEETGGALKISSKVSRPILSKVPSGEGALIRTKTITGITSEKPTLVKDIFAIASKQAGTEENPFISFKAGAPSLRISPEGIEGYIIRNPNVKGYLFPLETETAVSREGGVQSYFGGGERGTPSTKLSPSEISQLGKVSENLFATAGAKSQRAFSEIPKNIKTSIPSNAYGIRGVLVGSSNGVFIGKSLGTSGISPDFVRGFQNYFKASTPSTSAIPISKSTQIDFVSIPAVTSFVPGTTQRISFIPQLSVSSQGEIPTTKVSPNLTFFGGQPSTQRIGPFDITAPSESLGQPQVQQPKQIISPFEVQIPQIRPNQRFQPFSEEIQRQQDRQTQQEKQLQRESQTSRTDLISSSTTITRIPQLFPLIPTKKSIKERGKEISSSKELFIPFVRRRGKFSAISGPTTFERAFGLGKSRVESTLAASFQVRGARTGKPVPIGKSTLAFRPGKKGTDIFTLVQRRTRRLASPGERLEILSSRRGGIKWY